MNVDKAKDIAALVQRRGRYEQMLDQMQNGYADEWEFRNTNTGVCVDLTVDDWGEINKMIQREFNDLTEKIEHIN